MEKLLIALSDAFAQVPNRVLRYKHFVLTGLVVISLLMVWGIFTRTELDMTTDGFLDQADPSMLALNEYRRQFGSDDSVFLVYRAKDGDVFSRESLLAIQQLTNDLRYWQQLRTEDYPDAINGINLDFDELNHVRRVQSIANLLPGKSGGHAALQSAGARTTSRIR